jgi:hypothetical protein
MTGAARVTWGYNRGVNLFATRLVLLGITATLLPAADSGGALDRRFTDTVVPFVNQYCRGCHAGTSPAAQFDLTVYTDTQSVLREFPRWTLLLERMHAREMPPKGTPQPPEDRRQQVMDWIQTVRANELRRTAGDPGIVLARRLSNAEYNYTIRDLTGADLRPAREFPADPANPAGFDNSGESLAMTPALLSKYMEAAKDVADHMVLKPDGIFFASHPMLVETDRERYTVGRILDFYARQPTDFADYFEAAWTYKYRAPLGQPDATLSSIAAGRKLSTKYLPVVWQYLESKVDEAGPEATLLTMWRSLPRPRQATDKAVARDGCVRMREFVRKIRRHTAKLSFPPTPSTIRNSGGFGGSIVFAMWKNRMVAASHRDFDPSALRLEGEPVPRNLVVTRGPTFGVKEVLLFKAAVAEYIKERQEDPDLVVPAGQRARYEAALKRFANVFPDQFYLRERGRFYPVDVETDKGRYLSAGLHNMMGYFRDDTALRELIMDEKATKEIDTLWQEFEYISDFTRRTYVQSTGFLQRQETTEGGYSDLATEKSILSTRDLLLERYKAEGPEIAEAIRMHYDGSNAAIRWAERVRLESEPRHREALLAFARRAYRRPLEPEERDDILSYYKQLRDKSGMSHEEAVRASIVSLLVSPDFCYRVDLGQPGVRPAGSETFRVRPLSSYALASRLSYFLWSSMPDEELLAHARSGDLLKPAVLAAQAQRMLADGRSRGLALEFAGNWLGFRGFENHNAVDRERFPMFTNELRSAMFEEPVRFVHELLRRNGSMLDLLYGNYTYANPVLAKHYGMPEIAGEPDTWARIEDARAYGRGGLLPMSVFLTLNAPGLRTSPVKRGYWLARRVLGETIPPPPPSVPELPNDEAKSDMPVRELLAKHRENAACASCHARFDTLGIAFEGYGPVGERRTRDLAGRAVDTSATFPGAVPGDGVEGLRNYIRARRQKEFIRNLSSKMLVYALNRSPVLADEPLLEQVESKLPANAYRFSTLIEMIVTSPQFVNRREPDPEPIAKPQTGGR